MKVEQVKVPEAPAQPEPEQEEEKDAEQPKQTEQEKDAEQSKYHYKIMSEFKEIVGDGTSTPKAEARIWIASMLKQ